MSDTADPVKPLRLSDPCTWVDRHGDVLYRYALLRLRHPALAEEVVQETFLAALQARERFSGRSSERTWLVGILKHKIADYYRQVSRERPVEDVQAWTEETREAFDGGHWNMDQGAGPLEWGGSAESVVQEKEFREILSQCLSYLPERLAAAFTLREMEALNTKEVCKILNISATNLWVMLHRARHQMRQCLERRWFELE
jgi:RNA polymerase sigma-70 factor, ECF subfamily